MEILIHRVNTLQGLKTIPSIFGTEIDIRAFGSNLILNHEPSQSGDRLEDYLDEYRHGTLILNIKEAGIEDEVLRLVRKRSQIKKFFLLDVEFPYIYSASLKGERAIAVRFSEVESIETVKNFVRMVDWVWIDTNTKLPLGKNNISVLNNFKKCLVCPERWKRQEDIVKYRKTMISFDFELDAVMTSLKYSSKWLELL